MGNFRVYKSSAGSGKTYTLVKEYLKIVLPQPEKMRQILAITFTNAAAAEMKTRIVEELAGIASLAQNTNNKKARQLLSEIMADLPGGENQQLTEEHLIANAQQVIVKILHNYSDFSVSTIDSFTHRIVRSFAFDLHIPVNFEIELNATTLLKQAVDMLISRAGSDPQLTGFLIKYINTQADNDQGLRIEEAIGKVAQNLMSEESAPFIEKLQKLSLDKFLEIQKNISAEIKFLESGFKSQSQQALQIISNAGLTADAFFQGKNGIIGYFKKLSEGNLANALVPGSNAQKTLDDDLWYGSKATTTDKAAIDTIKEQLRQAAANILGQSNLHLQNYMLLKAVSHNLFPLGVLNEVQRMLQEIKNENVLLLLSDFDRKIAAIVAEQPVPFIYERIGERYQHYMIDEFQDTSTLQWQNLLPLIENGLATGNLSLVVGDGKQAIYRWRNGDVEQFVRLPELHQTIGGVSKDQWQDTLKRNYRENSLATNWRSRKTIVEFNNAFFEMAKYSLSEELKPVFQGQRQQWKEDADGGYVEISFIEKTHDRTYQDITHEKVKLTIERLLNAGHPYSDITILCRNKNKGSLLAGYLLAHQIPVISSDSLLLNQSEEVMFFIAILNLLANPHDDIAAAIIINYLIATGYFSESANLHGLLHSLNQFPKPAAPNTHNWQHTIDSLLQTKGIEFKFANLTFLNLYDVCESITRHFFSRGKPNPFVAFFMDAVFEYSEKNRLSISDFLQWWNESGKEFSLVVPKGLDAVQIMTIHKSKGLQFPVVIFAFADLVADEPTKNGTWQNPEHELTKELGAIWLNLSKKTLEHTTYHQVYEREMDCTVLDILNLAYVAMTRPQEKLFILSKKPPKSTTSRLRLDILLSNHLKQQNTWDDNVSEYQFGDFENAKSASVTNQAGTPVFSRLLSRSWTGALRMRSNQLERGLASATHRERGKLMHRALEQIKTTNDIDSVLTLMHTDGEIDQSTQTEWRQRIMNLLTQESLKACFEPGANIKTEAGLFDELGNFYRPDRVVLLKGKTVVIDYKTGKENQDHIEQINKYATLLESMGYPAVEKWLLYLDLDNSKTV